MTQTTGHKQYEATVTMPNTGLFADLLGQPIIVISHTAGVHFGYMTSVHNYGQTVRMHNARRVYVWKVRGDGITMSEVALTGIDDAGSKISAAVPDVIISGVDEILPVTGLSEMTFLGARVALVEN